MERFVRNSELLEAMDKASARGRCVSSLDSVARILEVEVTPRLIRQAQNLATRTMDPGAQRFLSGQRRRTY